MGQAHPEMASEAERIGATAPAGKFRGVLSGGVASFHGIRYAEPPVGALRFAPPVPAAPRKDLCEAVLPGPVSIQDVDPLPMVLPGAENNYYAPNPIVSEDCLNLNIWTPDVAGRGPVLVWIHGGAFLCGSGSGPWIDGSKFARQHGLVVVTLNYRLGYLGGLYLGDCEPTRSNLGLQDQILALRWVRDNIAAFGGDPDLVTIGGHSAGAMSTAALITAPGARGLFRRAIVESGHLDTIMDVGKARETTRFLLKRLSVDPDGDLLDQLRRLSTLRITAVQREFGISRRAFPLVGDDVILPSNAMAALAARADVDIMIGTTSEEDRLFAVTGWAAPARGVAATLARFLADEGAKAEGEALYAPVLASRDGDQVALTHLIATEHSWTEPARRFAETHSAAGGRSYLYEFGWSSSALEGRVGAAHLVDLPFLFDNLDAPGVHELLGDAGRAESAARLARNFSSAVAAFVRSGDPSGPLGDWPAYTPMRRATQVISDEPRSEIDRIGDRLDFWLKHRAIAAPALSAIGDA